jgi:hypothetical protein
MDYYVDLFPYCKTLHDIAHLHVVGAGGWIGRAQGYNLFKGGENLSAHLVGGAGGLQGDDKRFVLHFNGGVGHGGASIRRWFRRQPVQPPFRLVPLPNAPCCHPRWYDIDARCHSPTA